MYYNSAVTAAFADAVRPMRKDLPDILTNKDTRFQLYNLITPRQKNGVARHICGTI